MVPGGRTSLLATTHAVILAAAALVPLHAVVRAAFVLLAPEQEAELEEFFNLSRWAALLAGTSVVCAVAVGVSLAGGATLGLLIARTDLPGRGLLLALLTLLACIPVYVQAIAIFAVWPSFALTGSPAMCGLLYGLVYTPLAAVVMWAALCGGDRDLEDLARLDAGEWTVLIRVALPGAGWAALATAVLVLLLVATDFTIADILTVRTVADEVYVQYALGLRRIGPLLTGLPLGVFLAGLLVLIGHLLRRRGEASTWSAAQPTRRAALGRARIPLGMLCAAVAFGASGAAVIATTRRITHLEGLGGVVVSLQRELWTSGVLSMAAAAVIACAAPGLAWAALRGGRLRGLVRTIIIVLLALPAPLAGISLIGLLNHELTAWVYDSPLVVAAGYIVRFLPAGVVLLLPAVHRLPRELEFAARVDGCDWGAEHRHVRWPAVRRGVLVAWLIVVILGFGEVGASVLLAPPGWPLASVRAFTLMHFGVYRDLAVLALLSAGFIAAAWAALLGIVRCRAE